METPPILPEPENPELRQWTVIMHLSALSGLVIPCFANVVAPLVIWLIKKPELPALEPAGKSVLNFQISWAIWLFASAIFGFGLSCFIIPLIVPLGFFIAWLVFTIIGSVKASNGETYVFPLTIAFLK